MSGPQISSPVLSATLSFALLARVFDAISSSDGNTGLRLTDLNGVLTCPYRSFSRRPSTFPVLMKFFTILSSSEW